MNNPHSMRSRRTVTAPPIWNPLISEVATRHRIHPRDMLSGMKSYQAVAARHELWFRLHHERSASLGEIGRRLGRAAGLVPVVPANGDDLAVMDNDANLLMGVHLLR